MSPMCLIIFFILFLFHHDEAFTLQDGRSRADKLSFSNRAYSTLHTKAHTDTKTKHKQSLLRSTPESSSDDSSISESEHKTYILDKVKCPKDMKELRVEDLKQLAEDVRWDVIHTVSKTGGHLSAGLGVVELTVALHHVFDSPEDKIIWDVSHQAYPHKILTGRRERMLDLRQKDGLSGFCKRSESNYDPFGAGHSSTAISAAQGMSVAQLLQNKKMSNIVAVVGDGAITGGMAYEAMNSIGFLKTPLLVILNDNGQVSLPTGIRVAGGDAPASALSTYTARLLTSRPYKGFREVAKGISKLFPDSMRDAAARIDEYARGLVTGGTLFEELGFYYVGPVDGHDLDNLVPILQNIKSTLSQRPVFLHVKTEKGRGYTPATLASDTMHGVVPFDVISGKQKKSKGPPSFTSIFADELKQIAKQDDSVVAITAAMPGGTGVGEFATEFPEKTFDVGIAEQHAVTFAAGLATEGIKPFAAIYSTFLQRGYDQLIHDVALQNLPVRFIIDRAGFVGPDGATHHGSFDLAYIGCIPNMVIMAPSDEVDLRNMVRTAYEINNRPSAVRYPRGNAYGLEYMNRKFGYNLESIPTKGIPLEIGKGRVIKYAKPSTKQQVAILSIGTRLGVSVEAAEIIENELTDVGVTVADARFAKPLDLELIRDLASKHEVLITVEEGSVGGFGDHVLHFMALDGLLDENNIKVRPLNFPDSFIEQAKQDEQYEEAGLNTSHIVNTIKRTLQKSVVPIYNR